MAANDKSLPLDVARDIEPERSWENVTTPWDMVLLCAKFLSVNIKNITDTSGFVLSPIEPTGADRGKIWVKTEGMPGIGLPIGNSYQLISKYPQGVALLWTKSRPLPSYLRELSESELTAAGITTPKDSQYIWVINDES